MYRHAPALAVGPLQGSNKFFLGRATYASTVGLLPYKLKHTLKMLWSELPEYGQELNPKHNWALINK
jgi:hypothetical protein